MPGALGFTPLLRGYTCLQFFHLSSHRIYEFCDEYSDEQGLRVMPLRHVAGCSPSPNLVLLRGQDSVRKSFLCKSSARMACRLAFMTACRGELPRSASRSQRPLPLELQVEGAMGLTDPRKSHAGGCLNMAPLTELLLRQYSLTRSLAHSLKSQPMLTTRIFQGISQHED